MGTTSFDQNVSRPSLNEAIKYYCWKAGEDISGYENDSMKTIEFRRAVDKVKDDKDKMKSFLENLIASYSKDVKDGNYIPEPPTTVRSIFEMRMPSIGNGLDLTAISFRQSLMKNNMMSLLEMFDSGVRFG